MKGKAVTFRLSNNNELLISKLLKLNRHNFYPTNIDNRTDLLNLIIQTWGQQMLDSYRNGKQYDEIEFSDNKRLSHIVEQNAFQSRKLLKLEQQNEELKQQNEEIEQLMMQQFHPQVRASSPNNRRSWLSKLFK